MMKVRFIHYYYFIHFQTMTIHKQMSTQDVVYQMEPFIEDANAKMSQMFLVVLCVQMTLAVKAMSCSV